MFGEGSDQSVITSGRCDDTDPDRTVRALYCRHG